MSKNKKVDLLTEKMMEFKAMQSKANGEGGQDDEQLP